MSWDADLECACCKSSLHEQNYTHNTNRMVNEALATAGYVLTDSWWTHLHGKSGPEGAIMIRDALEVMAADRPRFLAMNPDNGWGDFDRLFDVLTRMCEAVPEHPTVWRVQG